jgi:hypothetical protein
VILKVDGEEIEVGSIGVQHEGWMWGIDSAILSAVTGGKIVKT